MSSKWTELVLSTSGLMAFLWELCTGHYTFSCVTNVFSYREEKEQAIANSIVNSSILSKSYVAISFTV